MSVNDEWDAVSYERVSAIQQKWGIKLLNRKAWSGSEKVLDAGCGPGSLTKILATKIPQGKIYAVDQDSAMVSQATKNMAEYGNVVVLKGDMSSVFLPEKVDLIFSNAALHWVLDHNRLFTHFRALLNDDGELLIQCGGEGNLRSTLSIIEKLRIDRTRKFEKYFFHWKPPWYFASADKTKSLLQALGYLDIYAELSSEIVKFSDRKAFSSFVRTVILRPYLSQITNDQARDEFATEFEESAQEQGLSLDYVRLTITAKK